ncbi:HAD family hydrolase [Vibrio mediterranei]|uniref:HAD family hydrolase n=1 Tax=Vibrio mediterranei TaxID=689 RepID=UPI00148D3792|nr:HAD family hydrolase [Vibrio mediterranei]NOI26385.1 HAD family hydrolase [Vibrio mediterranei]
MLPYKAVVSDLDGTLLNDSGQLSDTTLSVLTELSNKGVELILATGRHPKDAQQIVGALGPKVSIIGLNGALTLCHESGSIIDEHHIDAGCMAELLELIKAESIHLSIFDNEGWKLHEVNKMAEAYASFSGFPYTLVSPQQFNNLKVNKLLLWKEEGINAVEKKINDTMGGRIECYRTSQHQLEIGPPKTSKASAAIYLLSNKGISFQRQAIAFGDALNDLPMLSQAAQGVLMKNAMPELANQLSSLPITSCNVTDGVAHFLRQTFNI